MDNVLIILNHQPKIPPFMLTALHCAKSRYDQVYYVNTRYPKYAEDFGEDNNIHFLQPSSFGRKIAMFKAFFRLFAISSLKNIARCITDKGFKIDIIKQFLVGLTSDACIRPIANKIINNNDQSSITILSTWLAYCAYSAAWLKKEHKQIKAVSLAHSYEILVIRNPLVPYHFVDFKHKYLDGIFFIAHTMREMYLDGVGQLPIEYQKRMHVCHLGTYKAFSEINKVQSGTFNLCTCSRVIPLKRLDVLISALENWNHGKIRWTHIGDGPLIEELKQKAQSTMEKNHLVEIVFKGFVPNNEVEQYYATNPVDLFINLSNIEGLPISIMEAISYGIPVIATDVGGTKEIVTKEVGILLPQNITPQLVLNSIIDYYTKPSAEQLQMRKSAFNFWKNNYDAASNLSKLFIEIENL